MSTHNNNYEPTSRVNYERTTPNPYLHDTYLPPPPPEYYMHQRTGKAWKVAIPVVLLLFGIVVGVLAYPLMNSKINPSSVTPKPTPFVPLSMPAVTPTISTDQGMYSSNFVTFIQGFNRAMSNRQYDVIEKHTDTKNFHWVVLYSDGGYGNWKDTYDNLTTYNLTLSVEYPIVTAKQAGYECLGYYSQGGIPGFIDINNARSVMDVVGSSNDQGLANTAVFIFEIPNHTGFNSWLWRGYVLNNVQNCIA